MLDGSQNSLVRGCGATDGRKWPEVSRASRRANKTGNHCIERGLHTMTLSLNSVPTIEDLPPERVRGLLRRASTEFTLHWLSHALRSDLDRARVVVVAMERAGLVERDKAKEAELRSSDPYYRVTRTGRSLARASGAKRIERLSAEKTLTEFMERVNQSNSNQEYLYSVTRVAVFGSYLENTSRLGDVDVAVDLQPRIPAKRELGGSVSASRGEIRAQFCHL